jgi:hypothetical protein
MLTGNILIKVKKNIYERIMCTTVGIKLVKLLVSALVRVARTILHNQDAIN